MYLTDLNPENMKELTMPPIGKEESDTGEKKGKKHKKDKKHKKEKKHKREKKHRKDKKHSKHRDIQDIEDAEIRRIEQEVENEQFGDKFLTEGNAVDQMLKQEGGIRQEGEVRPEDIAEADLHDEAEEAEVIDFKSESAIAARIIDEMAACIDEDIEANKANRPALKKLSYSPQLLQQLKNKKVQEYFLDMGGCKYLADWLSKLPDGSFPNLNIIETGLEIADFLPIEKEHLTQTRLGKVMEKLRKQKQGSNDTVRRKCQEIINKWKRQILMLDGAYDEEGRHEEQYRDFKAKKMREAEYYQRQNKRQKTSERGERPVVKEEDKGEGEGDEPELKKQASGDNMFIPQKNNFDYTFRPKSRVIGQDKKVRPESVKGQFLKKMLAMKKDYNAQQKTTLAAVKPNLDPDKS